MSTRVVDRIEEWDERPFTGGYRGLQGLADREFSGVVRADGLELFMTRGVAVEVRGGDLDAFEDASGTVHEAPSPALPLLAVMQKRSEEVRDSFYTEQTAISAVDETLSDGGFTGYVELSENVLSGDYYLVYHAGKSMSVAFVGQSGRLVDGREAFETAEDEVGIYEVRPVDIEPIELPEPAPEPQQTTSGGESTSGPAESESDESEPTPGPSGDPTGTQATESEPAESADSAGGATGRDEGETPAADSVEEDEAPTGAGADGPVDGTESEVRTIPSIEPARTGQNESAGETGAAPPDQPTTPEQSARDETSADSGQGSDPPATDSPTEPAATDSASEQTAAESTTEQVATGSAEQTASETDDETTAGDRTDEEQLEAQLRELERVRDDLRDQLDAVSDERDDLRDQLDAVSDERDDLREQLDAVSDERDDLREQLDAVRDERDDLREQLDAVRDERDDLREERDASSDESGEQSAGSQANPGHGEMERRLTPQEARLETVVFVRYRSQGDVTLKDAHAGRGDQQSLRENLQLETYGGFEAAAAVEGQPYEAFVEGTLTYQFVEWVITEMLFEIRETGNQKTLQGLYDALPKVDHADLQGSVAAGEEAEQFDVVFRDQRERPLLVATIDSSRNPVTETQMEQLVTGAERVGAASDSLQGVFLVTQSYFDGGALEVADEATKGRLLSRDRRKSFVSLSRKQGYHLCLVEAREGALHLAVPEL